MSSLAAATMAKRGLRHLLWHATKIARHAPTPRNLLITLIAIAKRDPSTAMISEIVFSLSDQNVGFKHSERKFLNILERTKVLTKDEAGPLTNRYFLKIEN